MAPDFHFGEEEHREAPIEPSVEYLAVLGVGVLTLFDRVTIVSGLLIAASVGLLLFVAVVLHKLPEGFTIASVMLAAGRSRAEAMDAAAERVLPGGAVDVPSAAPGARCAGRPAAELLGRLAPRLVVVQVASRRLQFRLPVGPDPHRVPVR